MGKVNLTDISSWYTRLNNVRTYVGLTAVAPYETLTPPLKLKSLHMTTLKSQLDATQTQYNLTGTTVWDTSPGIAVGDKVKNTQFQTLLVTLDSLESVNVAQISYAQTTNQNGTNSNGTCSNSLKNNGTNSYGTCSDGTCLNEAYSNGLNSYLSRTNVTKSNVLKSNGTNSNGTNSDGIHWNGAYSNGTNSDGTKSNGCTETINTRETTYTNT